MDYQIYYKLLPGKTDGDHQYLPLWMHLQDTADVTEYLLRKRITASIIRASGMDCNLFSRTARFLALTHDLGKCTPLFTSKITPNIPGLAERLRNAGLNIPTSEDFAYSRKIPHALAGEILLRSYGCPDGISTVVGAHHGKPSENDDEAFDWETHLEISPKCYYAGQKEIWNELQSCIFSEALRKSSFASADELPVLSHCAQVLLCGILIQADWIASNQSYFALLPTEENGSPDMYPARSEHAFRAINLPDAWNVNNLGTDSGAYFLNRFGFAPNPMQKEVLSAVASASGGGNLLIIEAQMGLGKTEAALTAAELLAEKNGCGGVFFGLPTQATSNGLFMRMARWAESFSKGKAHSIRLVHGMAELNEDYQSYFHGKSIVDQDGARGLTVHGWFSGKKQALLADFVVGTVDTALMAALKQKHVMLRHLGLCGKVVVIDECHAYDAYMSRFLLCMLQWLGAYKIPVILLSATLPEEKRRQMVQAYCMPYTDLKHRKLLLPQTENYPLITWTEPSDVHTISVKETFTGKTVQIFMSADDGLPGLLKKHLAEGGCAGIIVNTVKRAQMIAEQLRMQLPDEKVIVYHAQFLTQERIHREKELLQIIGKASNSQQRDHVVVVGTQVLEQSLDIDFDLLITDLCPMDLLLQRIGRLHRHDRIRPNKLCIPQCVILQANGEYERGATAIYGKWLLKQTLRYLPTQILLPTDIPKLVNRVYAEPEESEMDDPAWLEFRMKTEIKESNADNWCLPRPKMSRRESGNSITGLLDIYVENDQRAEAAVRDGMPSIDVLVMCRDSEDHMAFLPWISNRSLRCDTTPSEDEAREIALQRLRLPLTFSSGKKLEETIDTLEMENQMWLSQWQESPWLKGELIMAVDLNGERDLSGYHLRYEKENGLQYERLGE